MKKSMKAWLIVAAVLIGIGLLLFAAVMTVHRWDFTVLNTVSYQTKTVEINDAFRNLSVRATTADLSFVPSEDDGCRVVCTERENVSYSVNVQNGTLTVEEHKEKNLFAQIGIFFTSPKITVYLPEKDYETLTVNISTGDVSLPDGFSFVTADVTLTTGGVLCVSDAQSLKIRTTTGDVKIEKANVSDDDVTVSTGEVSLSDVSCKTLHAEGTTGDVKLKNVAAENEIAVRCSTGDVKLDASSAANFSVTTTTGEVRLEAADAEELSVTTTTGDVRGTLRSEKIFIVSTTTGTVRVPSTEHGGFCRISTTTGDVSLALCGQ